VTPVNIFHPPNKVIGGLSLNILYGRNPSVFGLEVGAIVNRTDDAMGGIQISGVVNWDEGKIRGLAIAGIANAGKHGHCGGVCIAGLFNGLEGMSGLLISGFGNIVKNGKGVMVTPIMNHVQHDFSGLQIGFVNWNNFLQTQQTLADYGTYRVVKTTTYTWSGTNRALQISFGNTADTLIGGQLGPFNVARTGMRGTQLGGVWNHGGKRFEGLQLGAINSGGDVAGLQLGGINIARTLKGAQIGAINIATRNKVPVMLGLLIGNGKDRKAGR